MTGHFRYFIASAALLALQTAQPAHAEEASFTFHPSDLQTVSGTRQVLQTLRMAARANCRSDLLVLTKAERECRTTVATQWIEKIGNPRLSRLAKETEAQWASAD